MKTIKFILFYPTFALILVSGFGFGQSLSQADTQPIGAGLATLGNFNDAERAFSFIENKGQVHDQEYQSRPDVLFSGSDGALAFHLKRDGISYQLTRIDTWKERRDLRYQNTQSEKVPDQTTIYRLDINWLNVNPSASIAKGKESEDYNNYYLENCPNGVLHVNSYEEMRYLDIYPGIDLRWYRQQGHLKYEYLVAAGTDYRQVRFEVQGAEKISINMEGELVMQTPLGEVIEAAPLVMQNGKTLSSKWILAGGVTSFEIENLDMRLPFVIDPFIRAWGTYYGGAGEDNGESCAIDPSGNVYLAGSSDGSLSTIIATAGSHQSTSGTSDDAFLVKFSAAGVRRWGTYYGGAGDDFGVSCPTDANGHVYLAGLSAGGSSSVIATAGSHQPTNGGGNDCFLVQFDSAGVRQWGTYYGGAGFDFGYSATTDASGHVYLAGRTTGSLGTTMATAGSHQPTSGGGYDAFLVQFNSAGVRQWGTYYGGTGIEYGYVSASDDSSNVYLTGYTNGSLSAPIATAGSHQPTSGGGNDIFLVKFTVAGVRQWGTHCGGSGNEAGWSCATAAGGNVYVIGETNGGSLGTTIATAGSHQPTFGGGVDAFLVKFSAAGVRQWGTYYGGTGTDLGRACATDIGGHVYLGGNTNGSLDAVIATPGSHQPTNGGGPNDSYLVQFDAAGVRQWGTHYGGPGTEDLPSIATNGSGTVYIAGSSVSSFGTTIATPGSHQPASGMGIWDAMLVQFCNAPSTPDSIIGPTAICAGSNYTYSIPIVPGASSYTWTLPVGWSGTSTSNSISISANAASGNITVTADNACGSSAGSPQMITVNSPTSSSLTDTACTSYTLNAQTYSTSGVYTQTLTNAAGCDSVLTLNLTIASNSYSITDSACDAYTLNSHTYTSTGVYTQTLTNAAGCDSILTLHLTIDSSFVATVTQSDSVLTALPAGASYQWIDCNNGNAPIPGETNQVFIFSSSGNYAVIVSQSSCNDTSDCNLYTGLDENNFSHAISAFPNPTTGNLTLNLGELYAQVTIEISDITGRILERNFYDCTDMVQLQISGANGFYIIAVKNELEQQAMLKIVKE